jgi:outer membrane protein TolC
VENFLIAKALSLRRPVRHPMKVWRILAALPLLALSLRAADPAAGQVTLPEQLLPPLDGIIKNAVQQSPRMVSRALDLEIAENARVQARANLLPSLSAGYSYNKSQDKSEYLYGPGNPNNSINSYPVTKTPYSVYFSQPVFFWGERRNYDRIGQIQLKIAQGSYREAYRLLVQEVRGGYLRLIAQKLTVKRTRFYLEFANTQLKEQEDRYAKNVISAAEISTARLTAEQAQISLERTEFDYEMAKASFARLTGQAPLTEEAVPDSIPVITYVAAPFDQLLAGYLAQKDPPTNEAFVFRKQLEIENLNLANAKTRLRPKVSLVMGLSQDEQNNLYGTGAKYSVTSRYAGLSANWTIFDGFTSQAAERIYRASTRKMKNDYRQITERLAQDAQTQVKLINFSARSMDIYDRLAVSSEGYLKTMKEDFARGVKSETDVSQTQLSLYDNQLNALNARTDYLLKAGEFLGTLVEDPALANLADK